MATLTEISDAAAGTSTSYSLGIGQTLKGTVGLTSDHDWYKVNLVAGQTYTFAMVGTGVGPRHLDDPVLSLRNGSNTVIASGGDKGPGAYESITFTATQSGTYYLDAAGRSSAGSQSYQISTVQGTRASYDEVMAASALLRNESSWADGPGIAATVTWGVRQSYAGDENFVQLESDKIQFIKTALARYSDVANITFNQINPGGTTNNAQMLFSAFEDADGPNAYTYNPDSTSSIDPNRAGDVWINSLRVTSDQKYLRNFVHEIGHAVGLKHPGDYDRTDGTPISYETSAQFIQDSYQYTVMSYWDQRKSGADFKGGTIDTLMLYDIFALQQLYGANTTTRTGNTVYGFGSNAGDIYDFVKNPDPVLCIWDAGGSDTINASGFSQNQVIDLRAGSFSNIGGLTSNVSIAFGAVIENAIGGSGGDQLFGNSSNNDLKGGAGNDTLFGGLGNDTLDAGAWAGGSFQYLFGEAGSDTYRISRNDGLVFVDAGSENATSGTDKVVFSDLTMSDLSFATYNYTTSSPANGVALRMLWTGGEFRVGQMGDRIESFEFADGTRVAAMSLDTLGRPNLTGTAGNDIIHGSAGIDIMKGGAGDDRYYVDNAADQVVEGGGQGFDKLYTSISYVVAAGQEIDWLGTTLQTGTAAINLTGNAVDQTLTGNNGANLLSGGGDADTLYGHGGNDTLDGGTGADRMEGGAGDDTYYVDNAGDVIGVEPGSGGTDTVKSSITFDIRGIGPVEKLTLIGADSINGTGNALTNTITGNSGANVLLGLEGNDTLRGLEGNDTLNGGAGNDTLSGGAGNDIFVFDTIANNATNRDTITDFSNLVGNDDVIHLDNAVLTKLAAGALNATNFCQGAAALQADDYILYNQTTGILAYDADGNGANAAVQFALLSNNAALQLNDFYVI